MTTGESGEQKDGFNLTCHCGTGQKITHEHIHQVAGTLADGRIDRFDHGVNAAQKPELMHAIKERGIGMTICPQAYARRWPAQQVCPVIHRVFHGGIKIRIKSDDPTDMQRMYNEENTDKVWLFQLVRDAIKTCWASTGRREALYAELKKLQSR